MSLFQPWHEINWLDQAAHVGLGILIVVGCSWIVPWWAGFLISMAIAVSREQWQHPGQCHAGCRTDLLLWLLGSLSATAGLWWVMA